jgi:uncharacterized protein DUF6894
LPIDAHGGHLYAFFKTVIPAVLTTRGTIVFAVMLYRFYFHLVSGRRRIVDRTGLELDNGSIMSVDVEMVVKEVWPGTGEGGWEGWSLEIADEAGRIVRTVALRSSELRGAGRGE